MAKKRKKQRKATQGAKNTAERFLRPTAAREAHNDTEGAGIARRIVPPITTLHKQGKLCDRRYEALKYYRDQANLAEQSPNKDSCDFSVRGGQGNGPGAAIMSAKIETGRMERDLGALRGIVQAVARDDLTLTRYCVREFGGRERLDGNGKFVAMVPVREKETMARALLELRMAADMIVI
tara:strand:- start:2093 stop:2632 length:540 start_codon:yes stop_codon:yes gene_type:complete